MKTFTSCGLPWYPPPADGECPCDHSQPVRVLFTYEKEGKWLYEKSHWPASTWCWGASHHAGWYPVNPDGTEITSKRPPRPRVIRRRFKLKTR